MKNRFSKFAAIAFSAAVMASAANATEVKLRCNVSKVGVKHPYLPSEIALSIEGRYEDFFLEEVKISNVSTMPVPGEVTYQGRKKVRFSWDAGTYQFTKNALPRHNGVYRYPPSEFAYSFSLNKEDWVFQVDLKDLWSKNSHGSGKGLCVPV